MDTWLIMFVFFFAGTNCGNFVGYKACGKEPMAITFYAMWAGLATCIALIIRCVS